MHGEPRLKMNKKIIKVPYFKQKKDYTCGVASLRMIFKFYNKRISRNLIVKEAKTEKYKLTKRKDIIVVIKKHEFFGYINEHSSLRELMDFVKKGYPVIIEYIEPSGDDVHISIVVGFDKNYIIFNDPWNGKGFRLKQKEFFKRWVINEKGKGKTRWALVVSKDKIKLQGGKD